MTPVRGGPFVRALRSGLVQVRRVRSMAPMREKYRGLARGERGQAIVEVALVLPLLLFLIIGTIEFSLLLNARNTVSFASRDGSMLAAEGGSRTGTDCVVLQQVERDLVAPASAIKVNSVKIYWSDQNGDEIGSNHNLYTRGGTFTCDYGDGTSLTVPYTLTYAGYIEDVRCDVLLGCGGSHPSLDTIGVEIQYVHNWLTSFARVTGGTGLTFNVATTTRVEPQL
jgi:Flp pilus assembly protein TadG